jgi:hypothetical protein
MLHRLLHHRNHLFSVHAPHSGPALRRVGVEGALRLHPEQNPRPRRTERGQEEASPLAIEVVSWVTADLEDLVLVGKATRWLACSVGAAWKVSLCSRHHHQHQYHLSVDLLFSLPTPSIVLIVSSIIFPLNLSPSPCQLYSSHLPGCSLRRPSSIPEPLSTFMRSLTPM